MNIIDMAEFGGYLMAAWAAGFSSGYLMTKAKDAINSAV